MDADKPIIVIKKKGGHGGHHGGAWKIAYADFMTAMMAFFLVMWLVNSASTPTKERIASYFRRPGLFQEGSGTPLEIGGSGILDDAYVPSYPEEKKNEVGESQVPRRKGFDDGSYPATEDTSGQKNNIAPTEVKVKKKQEELPSPETSKDSGIGNAILMQPASSKDDEEAAEESAPLALPGKGMGAMDGEIIDPNEVVIPFITPQAIGGPGTGGGLGEMAEEIKDKIESSPELEKFLGAVDVFADANSINIEIMDTEKTSMFASGSSYVKEEAHQAFTLLAQAIQNVRNKIEIVGHTDAHPFANRQDGYGNWELSVDRANAARRLLIAGGVDPSRILGVLGKAETEPKNKEDPFAASNRRITLKMRFDAGIALAPTPSPIDKDTEAQTDSAAGTKSQETSQAQRDSTPEILERVHSLTPGDIVEQLEDKKQRTPKAPPETIGSPAGWKKPKFFGE